MPGPAQPDRQSSSTTFLSRVKQAYRRRHQKHKRNKDLASDNRSLRTILSNSHDDEEVDDETTTHKVTRWTMKAGDKAFDLVPDTVTDFFTPKGLRDDRALMVIGDCVDAFPELAHHVSERQWVEIAGLGDDLYWQIQLSFALAFGVAMWNIWFDSCDDGDNGAGIPCDTLAGTGERDHLRFGR